MSLRFAGSVFVLAPLLAIGFLCLAESQSQGDATKMVQAELKGRCATCHQSFVDEWKASGHAKAFTRAAYVKHAAAEKDRAQCDACHAPEPVLVAGADKSPKFRGKANAAEQGVMCVTCHMDASGAMHGPHGGESDFHEIVKDNNYQSSNAVCVSCHGQMAGVGVEFNQLDAFAAYTKNVKNAACADCHMRPVERQASTEDGKPKRQCGRHDWHGAYDEHTLQSAVTLQLRVSGTKATVSIANITGHMLPAGAWRQAVLEIVANNNVVKSETFYREFGGKTDTRLKSFERKRISAEVPAGAKVMTRLWFKLMPDTTDKDRMLMAEAQP